MLFEGVKFIKGHLKSPFRFSQGFVEGSVSSCKILDVLLGKKTLYAAGSPLGTRFLDLPEILCCWKLVQGVSPACGLQPPFQYENQSEKIL